MPRVYLSEADRVGARAEAADEALRVIVAARMMRDGLTQKEVAECIGIAPVTLSRRLAKPGTFTLSEIRSLICTLGLTDAEAARCV
jgi:predicted transcriptional regulator